MSILLWNIFVMEIMTHLHYSIRFTVCVVVLMCNMWVAKELHINPWIFVSTLFYSLGKKQNIRCDNTDLCDVIVWKKPKKKIFFMRHFTRIIL